MEGDLTLGGEHAVQYTNDVLKNCTLETYIILLTNVTSINSITLFLKEYRGFGSFMQCCWKWNVVQPC